MSDTAIDADALRQYLADTEPDPAELRDLLVSHYADFDAVKALLDYADGAVPLLAAVFAAHEQIAQAAQYQADLDEAEKALFRFRRQVDPWFPGQCHTLTDTDLLLVLRTARPLISDQVPYLFLRLSAWFIENAPPPLLTDDVVAEMSLATFLRPSPELGAGRPLAPRDRDFDCWLISRYLYSRFGDHGPSWDMFLQLHVPKAGPIRDPADQVVALRNRFGEHGPSWEVLLGLHGSQGLSISEAADKVAELRNQFGTQSGPWTVFMGIFDGSQTADEIDAIAKLVVELESPTS